MAARTRGPSPPAGSSWLRARPRPAPRSAAQLTSIPSSSHSSQEGLCEGNHVVNTARHIHHLTWNCHLAEKDKIKLTFKTGVMVLPGSAAGDSFGPRWSQIQHRVVLLSTGRTGRLSCRCPNSLSHSSPRRRARLDLQKQSSDVSLLRAPQPAGLQARAAAARNSSQSDCWFSPVTAAKWFRPQLILRTHTDGLKSERPNSVGGIISGVDDSERFGPFPRMP